MIIQIKRKHIKAGIPGACTNCPIALAVKDMGFDTVSVDTLGAIAYITIDNHEIAITHKCLTFMDKFDEGKPVKPFSFKLNLKPHV